MPLELGLFLGAKEFGSDEQNDKLCLILDREKYRYQKYCSDIAGQDIKSHDGNRNILIKKVRDWLKSYKRNHMLPGGPQIAERYSEFCKELPIICDSFKIKVEDLTYPDFELISSNWLVENSW